MKTPSTTNCYNFRVISVDKIVDGDTIDVTFDLGFGICKSERIRVAGIDSPEKRTRDLEEKERGLAAKARLTEILGKDFLVETMLNKRGKYGRVLGILHVENETTGERTNVNQQLVTEGHAVESFGGART